jgi:hypothetical protein
MIPEDTFVTVGNRGSPTAQAAGVGAKQNVHLIVNDKPFG